jgi:hypothetical protein
LRANRYDITQADEPFDPLRPQRHQHGVEGDQIPMHVTEDANSLVRHSVLPSRWAHVHADYADDANVCRELYQAASQSNVVSGTIQT